jgi:SAM-dependent methyltransferase
MDLSQQRKEASVLSKGDSSDQIKNAVRDSLQQLKLSPSKVLDLGCGKGEFLSALKNLFPHSQFYGSDLTNFNPSAFYKFLELDLNNNFAQNLPGFDLITSLEVIEHLENPRHFVREMAKSLNVGGVLAVSTPNPEAWTSILSFILRGYHSAFGGQAYPAHITPVPVFDLCNMFQETGSLKLLEVGFIPNGRMPGSDLYYHHYFPFLSGKRYSDNYFLLAKKVSA